MTRPSILDALADPALLGSWLGDPSSWSGWRAILAGAFALPMNDPQRMLFDRLAGGRAPPLAPVNELNVIAGRRGGKSSMAAGLAVFFATLREYPELRRGEVATIPIVAPDRAQCRTILRYVKAIMAEPLFTGLITSERAEGIELTNGCVIEVGTASHRSLRGYSCPLVVIDEACFLRSDESTSPDRELVAAARPAQSTFKDPLLVLISTPYCRAGYMYDSWQKSFGKDDPRRLVIQAETRLLNPLLDPELIAEELERDPAAARAEYLAVWRDDIESYISLDVAKACVVPGRTELVPETHRTYFAFADPSGGAVDSMTLCVGHHRTRGVVVDLVVERKAPFSPESVVTDFAAILKSYRCHRVYGDRYAGQWPTEKFRQHGIDYRTSCRPKSALYAEMLPMLYSGQVELPDNERMIGQLVGLERRTSRSGKDTIDHPPTGQDDVINAVAGALVEAGGRSSYGPRIT